MRFIFGKRIDKHTLKKTNIMKLLGTIAATLVVGAVSYAQTLQSAIYKTENERYSDARNEFNALIAKEPTNGENYFYFGDYYFEKGELDSAKMMWNKGYSVDQISPMSIVGKGLTLWLAGDQTGAKAEFTKAQTATKKLKTKNAEVSRGIAEIMIRSEKKSLDEAILLLQDAILKDPKNEDNYLMLGDAQYEKSPNNASEAIKSYNKVLEINPKSPRGLVRVAVIYQRAQNPDEANKMYKEAKKIDSTYAPAYRISAELFMQYNQPKKAIENWKNYLKYNNTIEARYRCVTALFLGKQYCETMEEVANLKKDGFSNFYTERMTAFSSVECTTNPDAIRLGMEASERFFQIAPAEKINYLDYKNKGQLLAKSGKDTLALAAYEQAASMSEVAKKDISGDMAKIYSKFKNYAKAIEMYEYKATVAKLGPAEEYDLGKAYYFGPANYALADSAFARVAKLSPKYAPAYWWRARTNLKFESADPKAKLWLSQPYYEKVIEIVKPEERANNTNKTMVMEAAKYLGDYYANSTVKDEVKSKSMWEIVIAIDPNDAQAKTALKIK